MGLYICVYLRMISASDTKTWSNVTCSSLCTTSIGSHDTIWLAMSFWKAFWTAQICIRSWSTLWTYCVPRRSGPIYVYSLSMILLITTYSLRLALEECLIVLYFLFEIICSNIVRTYTNTQFYEVKLNLPFCNLWMHRGEWTYVYFHSFLTMLLD
jgi:hypothetical protein